MANLGSTKNTECTYSPELMCSWYATKVIDSKTLRIYVPETNAADMRGAINFSEGILPGVEQIEVFTGDFVDIVYLKDPEGWRAECLRTFRLEFARWLKGGLR